MRCTGVRFCRTAINDQWQNIKLAKLWQKYNVRFPILDMNESSVVSITRDEKEKHGYLSKLQLRAGVPHVLIAQKDGIIETAKGYVRGYTKNAFIRGVQLDDEKEELLENGKSVFFEVLRAFRENDFSTLTEFTLGGNQTLQFHRNAAQKLTKLQKEALNITEKDLLGKSGYLIQNPYLKNELGPYFHSIGLLSLDANGNDYFTEIDGKQELNIYCRYKLILGGIYKFDYLLEDVVKGEGLWSQKIKTPRDYGFKWPRYTFVELDVCQQAERRNTKIHLSGSRQLYDFHVFSF